MYVAIKLFMSRVPKQKMRICLHIIPNEHVNIEFVLFCDKRNKINLLLP